jgi:hypothetical protein
MAAEKRCGSVPPYSRSIEGLGSSLRGKDVTPLEDARMCSLEMLDPALVLKGSGRLFVERCNASRPLHPAGNPAKMILSLKIPPGSIVSGRDARQFQSLFLRST